MENNGLTVKERCSIEEVTVEVTLRLVDGEPDNELTELLVKYLPKEEAEAKNSEGPEDILSPLQNLDALGENFNNN